MASPLAQGSGIYWAIGNLTHNLPGTFNHQSVDFSGNCEVKSLKNAQGQTTTWVFYDNIDELTFESEVIGSAGITNATVTLPAYGTKVTISGGPASSLDTATWVVFPPVGLVFGNENDCKFKCILKRAESITPV